MANVIHADLGPAHSLAMRLFSAARLLPTRETAVFEALYQKGKPIEAAASELGMSEQEVRDLDESVIRALKKTAAPLGALQ